MTSGTLPAYVRAAALVSPQADAVYAEGRPWTYRQLFDAVALIRTALDRHAWPGAGVPVGVFASRTIVGYAGMLAAMDGGQVAVPLNPAQDTGRTEAALAAARPTALIIDVAAPGAQTVAGLARVSGVEVVTVDVEGRPSAGTGPAQLLLGRADPAEPACSAARPDRLAYLIFTSGSTGRPKGVPITHRSARACLDAVGTRLALGPNDRVAQFAEPGFDVAVGECFLSWRAGACVYAPSFPELMLACDFARRHRLTVWSSVPTLAAQLHALGRLTPGCLPSLRLTLFCGEALPAALAASWRSAAPASDIVNLYGPTETAIFATLHVVEGADVVPGSTIPIGDVLPGLCRRILPAVAGADPPSFGELALGGIQLANGYWDDPGATRAAFVPGNPGDAAGCWYRTGDFVSLDGRGRLLFHGRRDRQIKLRGQRVELAVIEDAVRAATGAYLVAAVPERDGLGLFRSVSVFCDRLDAGERMARTACRALLPAPLVPRRLIRLTAFPRTATGKLDHHALARLMPAPVLPPPMGKH